MNAKGVILIMVEVKNSKQIFGKYCENLDANDKYYM